MQRQHPQYPDISEILARNAAGRKRGAALSFAQKLAVLDALKERVRPIIEARKLRQVGLTDIRHRRVP
jgi:hypothetical protein